MYNNDEMVLITPNGFTYELDSVPGDFGAYDTDLYVFLVTTDIKNALMSDRINLRYNSEEMSIVYNTLKTYGMKLFFYFNLDRVRTLSGFAFSIHGVKVIIEDIYNTINNIIKRKKFSFDNLLIVYLIKLVIVISLLFAYIWDCYNHGLFTFVPDVCKNTGDKLYSIYTTIFTDRNT